MAEVRPLVLLDPYPRNNAMILTPATRERLAALAEIVTVESGPVPDEVVEQFLPQVTAILGQTALPLERIERAPNLKAVFNVEGNFFPNVDYAACFARGIRVACAAPAFARPVAEFALATALDLMRGITAADRAFRAGKEQYGWRGNLGRESLFGADVGIVGFGNIARVLVTLLAPFGCTVRAHDPWLPPAMMRDHNVLPASLNDVLETSKVVFVLAAPTSENGGLIGAAELSRLREGAKIVLLSRAEVVDFGALTHALASGRIEAAIDVFPQEPLPAAHPLRRSGITLLSSHRAGGLDSALKLIGEMAIDDLALVLRGLPPVRLQSGHPETIGKQRSRPGLTEVPV